MLERYVFFKYTRQESQTLENYVIQLKLLVASCEYKKTKKLNYVDMTTNDIALQERLIIVEDLTLEKTIKIIKHAERQENM